jgi:rubrerythrin
MITYSMVRKAIVGEDQAIRLYNHMLMYASTQAQVKRLTEIRDDELAHREILAKMRESLGRKI